MDDVIDNCPDRAKHTDCPRGYIEWHAWARKKGRTHRQIRCEDCGRLTIWVHKTKRNSAATAANI